MKSHLRRIQRFIKYINSIRKICGYDKALRRALFAVLQRFFIPKKEQIILIKNGYKMSIIPNDLGISSELLMCKIHEPLTTFMLKRCIQKGWTVIDIGSNIGYYTLLESQLVGNKGKVIAIEPIPLNFSYLVKNIKLNKVKNVVLLNFAISNKKGNLRMIQSSYSNWSSIFTGNIPEQLENGQYKIIRVPVKTIDDIVRSLKLRDVNLIRIDVEGHELNVLQGARRVIKDYYPDFLIELHIAHLKKEKTKKLLEIFEKNSYQIKWALFRDVDFRGVVNFTDIKQFSFKELLSYNKNVVMVYFSGGNSR